MERSFFLNKLSVAVFLWIAVTLYIGTNIQLFKNFEHKIDLTFLRLPSVYNQETALITPKQDTTMIPTNSFTCMAENIYYEAGNQSYVGKLAVGQVVLNRTKKNGYPNSICGVIYDGSQNSRTTICQFSWLCDSSRKQVDKSSQFWTDSVRAATDLLVNKSVSVDLVDGATNYHADYVSPTWAKSLHLVTKIDNHLFYKERSSK